MPKPTGPTDPNLRALISTLRKNKQILLAKHLAKSRRSKTTVSIGRLNKLKNASIVAVPGKVLSVGELKKPITVYAWQFSKQARLKIEKAGGKAMPLAGLKEKAMVII